MLAFLLCLAALVPGTLQQQYPGCAGDVGTANTHPCGHAQITQAECAQLGCCWVNNACTMHRDEIAYLQRNVAPMDINQWTFENYNQFRCSAQAKAMSGGWDYTYSMTSGTCRVYTNRWDYFRQRGEVKQEAGTNSYEAALWHTRPRTEAEGMGAKESLLKNFFLGCFPKETDQGMIDVEREIWDWSGNTVWGCYAACRAQGYEIAGVSGSICSCTDKLSRPDAGESLSHCQVACPGDNDPSCGDEDFNAVYFVAPNDRFGGCYNNTAGLQQYPVWPREHRKSAQQCIDECSKYPEFTGKKQYNYFALVGNHGDCYCVDQQTLSEEGEIKGFSQSPLECMGRCLGLDASQAGLYCGMEGTAAVYSTVTAQTQKPDYIFTPLDWHRPIMKKITFVEKEGVSPQDSTVRGFTTNIFSTFPELMSLVSSRLIVHASHGFYAPFQPRRCQDSSCFTACGELWYDPNEIEDDSEDFTIRAWHFNLRDLSARIGGRALKRVYIFAQIVEITDESYNFDFALQIHARQIVIDRSKVHTLSVADTTDTLFDEWPGTDDDGPYADTLFVKQTMTCARILLNTQTPDNINTGLEILDGLINDYNYYDKEQESLATGARMSRSEFTGARRDGVRWVPHLTKSYIHSKMEFHHVQITQWLELYKEIVKTSTIGQAFLGFVNEMMSIFVSTNIGQWQSIYDEALFALDLSTATYHAMYNNYTLAVEYQDEAGVAYEEGLEKWENEQKKKSRRGFLKGVFKMCKGILSPGGAKDVKDGLSDIKDALQNLEETLAYLSQQMEKTEAMMAKLDYLLKTLEDAAEGGNLEDLAADVDLLSQLAVASIGWDNFKANAHIVMADSIEEKIGGAPEYLLSMIETSNWGKALMETMTELAENFRQAALAKSMLDAKIEMKERYEGYIAGIDADIESHRHFMIRKMNEMQHEMRVDITELLLTFCEMHFYENQRPCPVVPTFDSDMTDLLIDLQKAMNEGIFTSGVPGGVCRTTKIEDIDTDPECNDVTLCPVNMFRKTRQLMIEFDKDHVDVNDLYKYRVGEIQVRAIGAKLTPNPPHTRARYTITSASRYGMIVRGGAYYEFLSRAMKVTYEEDLETGQINLRAELYREETFSKNIHHRTPITQWLIECPHQHVDLSEVTRVDITFSGSAEAYNMDSGNTCIN